MIKVNNIVKVKSFYIHNIKNVKHGEISIPVSFEELHQSNLVGLYGQNGSGKTTVVEAFSLLKILISGWIPKKNVPESLKLREKHKELLSFDQPTATLEFDFLVQNTFGEYFVNYFVELSLGEEGLFVTQERMSYKENEKNKKPKLLIQKNHEDVQIRTKTLSMFNEDTRVKLKVVNQLSKEPETSFIFHKDVKELLKEQLEPVEYDLVRCLAEEFNRDLHIVNNESIGLLMTKMIMPFSIHLEKKRGAIPYDLDAPALLPKVLFHTLRDVIEQSNQVLKAIIPGLEIKIHEINKETNDEGEPSVRFEFLSKRGDVELPLRTESEGILKIISILSVLIATYNNPNACVVVDEIDAGVFEFLLGELLEVIKEGGQGQLIFTSHNLRILEVLTPKDLWFTTVNEDNRYIQLKGIKKMNNMRDVYLRAIQLGGQEEEIYQKTKTFQIKRAFRKAGVKND